MSDWADEIAEKHERLSRLDKTLFANAIRAAHIAGLREAAEMAFVDVETWHEKTGNPCRRIRDRILARIAELETSK